MLNQFREKTTEELKKLVSEWKAQLLALRFQQATGQLQKTHQFKKIEQSIARALTVLAEKEKGVQHGK